MQKTIPLSEIDAKGMEVFEIREDFDRWLNSNIMTLENQKPVTLLASPEGCQKVLNVLNAILHGIYL